MPGGSLAPLLWWCLPGFPQTGLQQIRDAEVWGNLVPSRQEKGQPRGVRGLCRWAVGICKVWGVHGCSTLGECPPGCHRGCQGSGSILTSSLCPQQADARERDRFPHPCHLPGARRGDRETHPREGRGGECGGGLSTPEHPLPHVPSPSDGPAARDHPSCSIPAAASNGGGCWRGVRGSLPNPQDSGIPICLGCSTQLLFARGLVGASPHHASCSAPLQLRRMQEMLQKIQKQMKDSH